MDKNRMFRQCTISSCWTYNSGVCVCVCVCVCVWPKTGQKRPKTAKTPKKGQTWPKTAKNRSKRTKNSQKTPENRSKWPKMAKNRSKTAKNVENRSKWPRMAENSQKQVKNGRKQPKNADKQVKTGQKPPVPINLWSSHGSVTVTCHKLMVGSLGWILRFACIQAGPDQSKHFSFSKSPLSNPKKNFFFFGRPPV